VTDDISPTARALSTLQLLQAVPGITADRLGDRLGVSERAARRYVAILREAGIPVVSERGPYGGYRLGRGLRLTPLMFTDDEALGLVMAVLDGHHDAADAEHPVGRALDKILRALPDTVATHADAVRKTTAPAPDRSAARPDPVVTTELVHACAQRCRVRLDYCSEAGSRFGVDVDPWAVVVRHARWYLLCHSHTADAQRAYRIDRIRALERLTETFDPPADLDPVAMLEDHLAVGWEYDVDVVIDAPIDAIAPWLPRALGHLESIGPDTTRLTGSTSNPTWYATQLSALPSPYRIIGCAELQAAASTIGQRLLDAATLTR
jgi:predicted DNA-binding transcriptional regulator YafY